MLLSSRCAVLACKLFGVALICLQLFTPGTSMNHHYHNLANWAGKLYFRLDVDVHVNVASVAELVAKAVAEVRQRIEAKV